jgi:hypothetical protein
MKADRAHLHDEAISAVAKQWAESYWIPSSSANSVLQFGALSSDVSATQAISAAVAHRFMNGGGEVRIPSGEYLLGNLLVPTGVSLIGESARFDPRYSRLIKRAATRVNLAKGCSLSLAEAASIYGLMITPEGSDFPMTADQILEWKGTAVKVLSGAHGAHVDQCNIVGFEWAIRGESNGTTEQVRVTNCNFDCSNGIEIWNATDVALVSNCHFWPTAGTGLGSGVSKTRSGTGLTLRGRCDWARIESTFFYGYQIGIHIDGAQDCLISNCGIDNDPSIRNRTAIGVLKSGRQGSLLIGASQFAALDVAVADISLPTEKGRSSGLVRILNGTAWDCVDLIRSGGGYEVSGVDFRKRVGL